MYTHIHKFINTYIHMYVYTIFIFCINLVIFAPDSNCKFIKINRNCTSRRKKSCEQTHLALENRCKFIYTKQHTYIYIQTYYTSFAYYLSEFLFTLALIHTRAHAFGGYNNNNNNNVACHIRIGEVG